MEVDRAPAMQSGAKRTAASGVRGGRRRYLESATPTVQTLSQAVPDQTTMCRQCRGRARTGWLIVGGAALGKFFDPPNVRV